MTRKAIPMLLVTALALWSLVGCEALGLKGTDGIDGIDGANGLDGKDGTNGVDGVNGTNGANGLAGTNGTNGTNGADGVDGMDSGVLGSSVYLSYTDSWSQHYTVKNGEIVSINYSMYGPTGPSTSTISLINESSLFLTLGGTVLIEDLGGWQLVGSNATYGTVPSISAGTPSATTVGVASPLTFDLTFTPPTAIIQDSRYRKRFRIALLDSAGTHYSFDFEVEAMITC